MINKIDLPSADVMRAREEIDSDLGLDPFEAVEVSAKTGAGVDDLLEALVEKLPPPTGDPEATLQALIFDAQYDVYRGVVMLVRVKQGTLKKGQDIFLMHTKKTYQVEEVGLLKLKREESKSLEAGNVGYVIAGVKSVRDITIGDTVTGAKQRATEPLPGYRPARPVVFASLYPIASDEYEDLTAALEKLSLNDAALTYEKDSSAALGFGFRCGFLGLLHLEVVQQRLEREFDLALLLSAPTVSYKVQLKTGEELVVDNPVFFPDPSEIEATYEPYIKAQIWIPERYVGTIMELCRDRRADDIQLRYLTQSRVEVNSILPLGEVLFDFYDKLKSYTQGYGSFDYEMFEYRETRIVKVDILVNGEPVDALSQLTHEDRARQRAMHYCERLEETIPRQQFKIAIQGAIGGKIIARTTINAFRKDVTAKCYGGDITRKRKLLEKQREGKKKMKIVGSVEIPQEAFVAVLKSEAGK